jgi:hypothetical protein
LDGKELIPELTDNSFAEGKIALWTKSDSLSYFTDIKIIYTPRETLAKTLVRELMQEYPRLLELKVFATTPTRPELHVVASNDPKAVGQPAGQYEQAAIRDNAPYSGRGKGKVIVTLPVHDSNGYAVAVLRIVLPSYFGQTDQNALSRTRPILKAIEDRVRSLSDLTR